MVRRRRRGAAIVDSPKGILVVSGGKKVFILPGGGANKGESRKSAAMRELHEETGLVPKSAHYLFSYIGSVHKDYRGGHFQDHNKVFLVKATGAPKPRHEIRHIAYWKPGSDVNISRLTRVLVERYVKEFKK